MLVAGFARWKGQSNVDGSGNCVWGLRAGHLDEVPGHARDAVARRVSSQHRCLRNELANLFGTIGAFILLLALATSSSVLAYIGGAGFGLAPLIGWSADRRERAAETTRGMTPRRWPSISSNRNARFFRKVSCLRFPRCAPIATARRSGPAEASNTPPSGSRRTPVSSVASLHKQDLSITGSVLARLQTDRYARLTGTAWALQRS